MDDKEVFITGLAAAGEDMKPEVWYGMVCVVWCGVVIHNDIAVQCILTF